MDEKWWTDSMACTAIFDTSLTACRTGKTLHERRVGGPIQRTGNSFWFDGWVSPSFCQRPVKTPPHQFGKKVSPWNLLRICIARRENLQSGWKWWADSVECCCDQRYVQEILWDWKTVYERRFGEPFIGPIILFLSMVAAKDQATPHLSEHLRSICVVCGRKRRHLWSRRWGTENFWRARINARRLHAKEVLKPKSCDTYNFPCTDGAVGTKRSRSPNSHPNSESYRSTSRRKVKRTDLIQKNSKRRMTQKAEMIFDIIVFTVSQESNSMCQTKGQSQYHWQICMLSGGKYDFGGRNFCPEFSSDVRWTRRESGKDSLW